MGVHLRGVFLLSKAAQKFMTEAKVRAHRQSLEHSALGNRGQVIYVTGGPKD